MAIVHPDDWVVWKFYLDLGDNEVRIPHEHEWLSVAFQHGKLVAWALVCNRSGDCLAKVTVRMTGEPNPRRPRHFIGTAMTPDQSFVVHVWHEMETGGE